MAACSLQCMPSALHPDPHPRYRVLVLLLVFALVAVLLTIEPLHDALLLMLAAAEPVIAAHPVAGMLVFVLLSALSAMVAFFSSALLVPVAVYSWGQPVTMLLLWSGWLLGGLCAYAIGASLGRPLLTSIGAARLLAFYRERLPGQVPFVLVLLLQLALPSEIPGYLFGLLRMRMRTYLAALALAEIPFVVGTVLVGESVVEQRGGMLLLLGALGVGISLCTLALLRRRLHR
jgi:uncharacterized membrane protein YdjX (TVP38/TMEM64 family)